MTAVTCFFSLSLLFCASTMTCLSSEFLRDSLQTSQLGHWQSHVPKRVTNFQLGTAGDAAAPQLRVERAVKPNPSQQGVKQLRQSRLRIASICRCCHFCPHSNTGEHHISSLSWAHCKLSHLTSQLHPFHRSKAGSSDRTSRHSLNIASSLLHNPNQPTHSNDG